MASDFCCKGVSTSVLTWALRAICADIRAVYPHSQSLIDDRALPLKRKVLVSQVSIIEHFLGSTAERNFTRIENDRLVSQL